MLHSLRKIIQAVSAAEDLQSALNLVVHQVRRAMRTDVCSIYLHFPKLTITCSWRAKGLTKHPLATRGYLRAKAWWV